TDTPKRVQQELTLQLALGAALVAVKGYAASEVEKTYTRARELCQRLGETPQLVQALLALCNVRHARAEYKTALELAEQCLSLAQRVHSTTFLVWAHYMLGMILYGLGEFALARDHLKQAVALYDPQKDNPLVSGLTQDYPKISSLTFASWTLWYLGYPNQGL